MLRSAPTVKRFAQPRLRHIVLILADTDGFGVDFDQLRERVLKPARDGYRRAEIDVVVRKFLGGQLGGGVDGRARLGDDHVGDAAAVFADKFRHEQLALLGGRAVADGDAGDMMARAQAAERLFRVLHAALRLVGVDNGGVEHLAGRIHDRELAAVTVAGVEAERHSAAHGRLHEQRTQIERKDTDGLLARLVGQLVSRFTFERGA